ncbi:hypothetical protein CAP36_00130 [Chitinophagaceae bacterium IBVUCB2]|nr:hypothetical protein CAP36_00130 [Chitinophagaceae bacterium IBVUCB2]
MFNFKTLPEAVNYFSSEERCRDMFEKLRWQDGNIICPNCLTERAYRMSNMIHYKCRNKSCGSRFSITKGTLLEATKLPLGKWFTAMYLVMSHKKGISSHQLGRDLGVGQKAAWFVLCRIREIMKAKTFEKLDNIVEIDETYVGGKFENMHRGRRKKYQDKGIDNKVPVMGMIERDGKARLKVIGKETFKDLVRQNVDENAQLVTDTHKSYVGLNYEYAGHNSVNHSIQQYKDGIFHTNSIEGAFSHFKRMVFGIYHQVSPKHLHRYCDEFTGRWNSRKVKDNERFVQFLQQTEGRLKWKDLTAK